MNTLAAMDALGVPGFMTGTDPTNEAEYLERVQAAPGHTRPAWADVQAKKLAMGKLVARRQIVGIADRMAVAITGDVPLAEQLSWTTKAAAAAAHLTATATVEQTAMLQAEASLSGETLTVLANRVLSNSSAYATAAGAIAGFRRAQMAAIDAAIEIALLDQIVASAQAQADAMLAQITGE